MAYTSIGSLFGFSNPSLIGNGVGLVLPDQCPVKSMERKDGGTRPCAQCPTDKRGDMNEPSVLKTARDFTSVLDQIVNLMGVAIVGDEPFDKSWALTKAIANHLAKRGIPCGAITIGHLLGNLVGEIEATPGLKYIGVSTLDVPQEYQGGFRDLYDETVASLKVAMQSAHMREIIHSVQVLRPGKIDWLRAMLPVHQELEITSISVSGHIDFEGAGQKPIRKRLIDLGDYAEGLLGYTAEAAQMGITVHVDDVFGDLDGYPGLSVRKQPRGFDNLRIGHHGFVEANKVALGKLNKACQITDVKETMEVVDRAIKYSRQFG